MQRYRITLKPYRDQLVDQPLDISEEMDLTDEQINGIYEMIRNLTKKYNHDAIIEVKKWDGKTWIDFIRNPDYFIEQTPLPYSDHFDSHDRGVRKNDWYWREYLDWHLDIPQITKRYVMIFPSYIYSNLIYQFNTPEFLQGLLTGANWLRVDGRDWILDLHEGNTEMTIA